MATWDCDWDWGQAQTEARSPSTRITILQGQQEHMTPSHDRVGGEGCECGGDAAGKAYSISGHNLNKLNSHCSHNHRRFVIAAQNVLTFMSQTQVHNISAKISFCWIELAKTHAYLSVCLSVCLSIYIYICMFYYICTRWSGRLALAAGAKIYSKCLEKCQRLIEKYIVEKPGTAASSLYLCSDWSQWPLEVHFMMALQIHSK